MSGRNTKLILRVVTLVVVAGVLAIAVLVVSENRELAKLLPASPLRTLLMVLSPLVPIVLTNYQLSARSFGAHDVTTELFILVGIVLIHLSITLTFILADDIIVQPKSCLVLELFCSDEHTQRRINVPVLLTLLAAGFLCIGEAFRRAGLFRAQV